MDRQDDIAAKPVRSLAALQAQLKPGDILVMSSKPVPEDLPAHKKLISSAFRRVSRAVQGDLTHSALYTGRGNVVEMRMDTGVRAVPLDEAVRKLDVAVVRPNAAKGTIRRAIDRVRSAAERKPGYDTTGLFRALAANVVKLKPSPSDTELNKATCSTLIADAYKSLKFHAGKPRDAVMPVDFLRAKNTTQVARYVNPGRKDRE